jgi:hypothetical protein
MNYRTKNKIIEAICKGKTLFIKDTGIAVAVTYFGSDADEFRVGRNDKNRYCHIEFISPPTMSSLTKFKNYHIKKNSHSGKMELDGTIDISNLSLTPYESKAGKLLYGKKGK